MKTPDEIKNGLECCLSWSGCVGCPYDDGTKDCDVCRPQLLKDALSLIQQ